jgi:hypothetical protein
MQTARMLEAEWRQVLWRCMSTGAKEDESSTGRIWASGFHHFMSIGARFETYEPVISLIFNYFGGCHKPRVTETADTESVDTGAQLYFYTVFLHVHSVNAKVPFCLLMQANILHAVSSYI